MNYVLKHILLMNSFKGSLFFTLFKEFHHGFLQESMEPIVDP